MFWFEAVGSGGGVDPPIFVFQPRRKRCFMAIITGFVQYVYIGHPDSRLEFESVKKTDYWMVYLARWRATLSPPLPTFLFRYHYEICIVYVCISSVVRRWYHCAAAACSHFFFLVNVQLLFSVLFSSFDLIRDLYGTYGRASTAPSSGPATCVWFEKLQAPRSGQPVPHVARSRSLLRYFYDSTGAYSSWPTSNDSV